MGDRYTWGQPCPKCGELLECYYAESCGIHDAYCQKCKTEFEIQMCHTLVEKKKKPKKEKQ